VHAQPLCSLWHCQAVACLPACQRACSGLLPLGLWLPSELTIPYAPIQCQCVLICPVVFDCIAFAADRLALLHQQGTDFRHFFAGQTPDLGRSCHRNTRAIIESVVKAKSQFKTKSYANNVEVYIQYLLMLIDPLSRQAWAQSRTSLIWTRSSGLLNRCASAQCRDPRPFSNFAVTHVSLCSFMADLMQSCVPVQACRTWRLTSLMQINGERGASASSSKCHTILCRESRSVRRTNILVFLPISQHRLL